MRHRPGLTPRELTALADQVAQGHRVYQQALLGVLASVMGRPDGAGRSELEHRVYALAETTYKNAVQPLHDMTGRALQAGIAGAGRKLSDKKYRMLESLVLESITEILEELRTVIYHDALRVRKTWQRYAIETALAKPRLGINAPLFMAQNRIDAVRFRVSDRLGRQWESANFIHNLVRGMLLETMVESFLYVLAQHGTDTAEAAWDDGRDPVRFSISGANAELPSYLTMKASLFHPNSTATVETVR